MFVKSKGKKVKLTSAMVTKNILIKLQEKFNTDLEIAEELGCSKSNIGRLRRKFDMTKDNGRPIGKEYEDDIIKMAEKGSEPHEVVEELGVHLSTVYKFFPTKCLNEIKKRKKEERRQEVEDAFNEGLTFMEMCERFDLHHTTMRSLLSTYKLSIRERDAV